MCFFARVARGLVNSADHLVSGKNLYLSLLEDSSGVRATRMILFLSPCPALCSYLILALKPFLLNENMLLCSGLVLKKALESKENGEPFIYRGDF